MQAKGINIDQFKDIIELYSFIDENAYNLERNWDLTDLWILYRNHTEDDDEKQKSQWEIDFSFFELKGSQVFSQAYSMDKTTPVIRKYPDLDEIQKSVIEYVLFRADSSKNPTIKARYYHLLWKSPNGIKNNTYAKFAIENYIFAIDEYYKLFLKDNNKETPFQIGKNYECLIAICDEVKSHKSQLKDLTNFLLFKATELGFYTKQGILDDMLNYPKIFKPLDFENTLTLFEDEIKLSSESVNDFSLIHFHLPSAIKIASKIKTDVRKWHNEVGLAYIRMANAENEVDRNFIKLNYYYKAIEAFILAGNNENKKETEYQYAGLKPKVKLTSIEIKFDEATKKDFQEYQNYIEKVAEKVLQNSSGEVYKIIASGYFFPKYDNVLEVVNNKKKSFLDFVTTIQFDKNKNISIPQKENLNNKKIFSTYGDFISGSVIPYLHFIIIPGIKSGHLTFENFIAFLTNYTWIGTTHIKYDIGGEEKNTNWIGLLAPSIIEFFIQMQAWSSSKYYMPSFVLCVDSLTLKMEGLLREFCERAKIPTSVSRQKGVQEAYVHNVLENEGLKKYFNEDDLLFFNYLFTNEGGLNLRNNIAHCFFDNEDYSLNHMLLLLAALLRLGKYDWKLIEA